MLLRPYLDIQMPHTLWKACQLVTVSIPVILSLEALGGPGQIYICMVQKISDNSALPMSSLCMQCGSWEVDPATHLYVNASIVALITPKLQSTNSITFQGNMIPGITTITTRS
ncbi:hypothetical protein RSAG8_05718, partial [Rhizoctonia solani AG-8 WAC10335]